MLVSVFVRLMIMLFLFSLVEIRSRFCCFPSFFLSKGD